MRFYLLSLQRLSTTVGTVANFGFNFLATAVLSSLLLGESLPFWWWVGVACIVGGLTIVAASEHTQGDKRDQLHSHSSHKAKTQ